MAGFAPPSTYAPPALALIGAACFGLVVWSYQVNAHDDLAFLAMVLAQSLLALLAGWIARLAPDTARALAIVLIFAAAPRVYLLLHSPMLSVDVFHYVWEGREDLAGYNPYLHVPSAPELAFLRDDVIYPWVDKKDYAVSIYPPAAHLIFVVNALLGGGMIAMKALMVAFEAVTAAALISLLAQLRLPRALAVVYLWAPAPQWEIADNGHIDAAMTALVLGGFAWGVARKRVYLAGALIALGAMCKPFAALALPTLWRPFDIKLPAFVVGLAVACYLPFLSAGAGVLGFLGGYARENGLDTGSAFFTLRLFFGAQAPPAWATYAYYGLAAAALAALIARACLRDARTLETALRDTAAILVAFLFFLSSPLPWYLLVLAPFAPLTGSRACFVMPAAGFLLYPIAANAWGIADGVCEAAYYFLALTAMAFDAKRLFWTSGAAANA